MLVKQHGAVRSHSAFIGCLALVIQGTPVQCCFEDVKGVWMIFCSLKGVAAFNLRTFGETWLTVKAWRSLLGSTSTFWLVRYILAG